MIEPKHLDGLAALIAAESTPLRKLKGERDTEYVKRIVCAYMNAVMGHHPASIRASAQKPRHHGSALA